ncbi:maltose permease [Aspergillus granulosus]|uniref:Maltose permease n=1 Tax=Aspergillus granulosus TaxID=176169 RepID=A0ABR4HD57_9EURO
MGRPDNATGGSELETTIEQEKHAIGQHIEALVEEEHNLTFLAVCRLYPKIVWWSFFWCLTAVAWGFEMSVNSAIISVPSFRAYYGYMLDGEPVIPAEWLSAFGVCSYCGLFFGGFVCSAIADRYGRKIGLAVGIVVATGGIFGEIFATSRPSFLVSKLILGIGVGFYLTLGPVTCSEFAPVVLRGLSTSGVNLGIGVGGLLSKSVTRGFGTRSDEWAFRAPFTAQLFFSLILIAPLYFAPESPWFLVRSGQIEKARKTLTLLYSSESEAEKRIAGIFATIRSEAQMEQPSYMSAFKGTDRIRTLISMGVFVAQQAVGIIFVLSFAPYLFQLAGLSVADSLNFGVGISACGIVGNVTAWFVVNRIGRRLLFTCGVGGCSLVLWLIGFLDLAKTQSAKWGQGALCVVYAYIYYLTLGAVSFVLLGEVSSLALRARTTALATATQAVLGIVFQIVVPYLVNPDAANLKGKVGFVFGGTSLIATILAIWYIPELKGRTHSEIDEMFFRRVPPRNMGAYVLN